MHHSRYTPQYTSTPSAHRQAKAKPGKETMMRLGNPSVKNSIKNIFKV
jgi:hypothetical protein